MKKLKFSLAALALLTAGCGGGGGGSSLGDASVVAFPQPVAAPLARGKAHLSSPVVGATVKILDATGHVAPGYDTAITSDSGTFRLMVDSTTLGGRFRVAVSGGTYEGQAFKDTLLLDVENFHPDRQLLYVNAATTLVSRHIDRHAGTSVSNASTKVLGFLQIPVVPVRAGFAVDNPRQDYFGHEVFLAAMQKSGAAGVGTYIDTLETELDVGVPAHSFGRFKVGGDIGGTIGKFVKGLAGHLGSELFSWGFESILTTLGVGANAEILDELHEINAKLDEVLFQTQQLVTGQKLLSTQITDVQLLDPVSNITTRYQNLTFDLQRPACLVDKEGKPLDTKCADEASGVQDDVRKEMGLIVSTDLDSQVVKIGMALSGDLITPGGLLLSWNDYLTSKKVFVGGPVDPAVIELKEYYQALQVMGTNLLIEVVMATTHDKKKAGMYLDRLTKALKAQDDLVATIPTNLDSMQDTRTGLFWMRAPYSDIGRARLPWENDLPPAYQPAGFCEVLAGQNFGGFSTWRLPTDPELHVVVGRDVANEDGKTTHNNDGSAHSAPGNFKWLVGEGFLGGDGNGRGFVEAGAYFSSTTSGISGNYYEALRDDGVDYTCRFVDSHFCEAESITTRGGAWCVAGIHKE